MNKPPSKLVADIWVACEKDKKAQGKTIGQNMHFHWKAIGPFFGRMEAEAITKEDCRKYAEKRRAEGRAESTIATELKHLRLALNWAAKGQDPIKAPFIEVPADSDPRNRYLTKAEMRKLIDNVKSPHIGVAMELLLATAGRVGAVLELTWDRVDFERGKIQLKKSEKGKGRAVVAMSDRIRSVLEKAHHDRTCEYVVEYASGPVKSIRKGIANAAARAGVEDVSPHVFRHTAAVWMAEDDQSMEEIAQFLGHRDVSVTRRVYARYSPEHLKRAAKSLEF
jgi:integrase